MKTLLFNRVRNSRNKIIAKNALGSLVNKGISIIVSLLMVPLTLNYVSSEVYGIWLTLSTLIIWISFFDVGLNLGLKNKLTEALALEQWQLAKALISTMYMVMSMIFIPVFMFVFIVTPLFDWPSLLNVSEDYGEELIVTVRIVVLFFCLQMIAKNIESVLSAFQRTALVSLFTTIAHVISLFIIFLLTKFTHGSLVYLAFAISAPHAILLIIMSVYFYKVTYKRLKPSISSIDLSLMNSLMSMSTIFFIIQIQVMIMVNSTNFIISNVASPIDVTNYNIAFKYLSVSMMIFNIILVPIWPAMTDAYTKGDFKWMSSVYKKMIYAFLVSTCLLAIMVVFSNFVYDIWVGNSVVIPFQLTLVISIYIVLSSWVGMQATILNGIGKIRLQMYTDCLGIFIHIPLSFVLGKTFGAIGVVTSMIIVYLMYSLVLTTQCKKIIRNEDHNIWAK